MAVPFGLEDVKFRVITLADSPVKNAKRTETAWSKMSASDATDIIDAFLDSRSASIRQERNALGRILDRHMSIIVKRWLGKNKKQRCAVLEKAWDGDMHSTNRASWNDSSVDNALVLLNRDAWLWPEINKEGLCDKQDLLTLLDARAQHDPVIFTTMDVNSMDLIGSDVDSHIPTSIDNHFIVFRTLDDPLGYCALTALSDGDNRYSIATGLLLLEVQERKMRFLVECVMGILHDIKGNALMDSALEVYTLDVSTHNAEQESLARTVAQVPYQAPKGMDLARLRSLLSARYDATTDHLWSLREDPAHYEESIRESASYRWETIPGQDGVLPTRESPDHALWNAAINDDVVGSCIALERWSELKQQVNALQVLLEQRSGNEPSQAYVHALLRFRHYVLEIAAKLIVDIERLLGVSAPFHEYVRMNSDRTRPQSRVGRQLDKAREFLDLSCTAIREWGRVTLEHGRTGVIDELQLAIDSDGRLQALIAPLVAVKLADLGTLTECTRVLQLNQPLCSSYIQCHKDIATTLKADFAGFEKRCLSVKVIVALSLKDIGYEGHPEDRRLYYPIAQRRTQANVNALRAAEAILDRVWSDFGSKLGPFLGKLAGTATGRLLANPRPLYRTAPWAERLQTSVPLPQPTYKVGDTITFGVTPLNTADGTSDYSAAVLKTKKKTKGIADPALQLGDIDLSDSDGEVIPEVFRLNARALKVFSTMFFTVGVDRTPGEVSWRDFLYGMAAMGFSSEKLRGSEWRFAHPQRRPIIVHDPHPKSNIPYERLRRVGRRMNRAYGWEAGMFEQA
nr:hypothetical protein B0A51_05305 [Rachicladosporium sp. CCFEE 5018]